MSLAEIIAQKYKPLQKINNIKSPEEAAKVLIRDTKEFNVNDETYVDGSLNEQKEMALQLGDVETNTVDHWKDLPEVKQNLWNKLHGISKNLKTNISKELNNLA